MIAIRGSIQARKYQDKDGNNRTAFEVVADDVQFADSGKKDDSPTPAIDPANDPLANFQNDFQAMAGDDSDLPF